MFGLDKIFSIMFKCLCLRSSSSSLLCLRSRWSIYTEAVIVLNNPLKEGGKGVVCPGMVIMPGLPHPSVIAIGHDFCSIK